MGNNQTQRIRALVQAVGRAETEREEPGREALFLELLGSLDEIVWSYSVIEHRILYVNEAAERIYGRSREEFLNHPELWRHAIHPDDRARARAADDQVMVWNRAECDCRIIDAAGKVHWLHFSLYRVGTNGERVIGVGIDITERMAAEERIRELACFDPLTGLPNRRLLAERFGQLLAEARQRRARLALCVVDLDHFKRVNDTLGHSVGDRLLRAVAERVREMEHKDDVFARLGGDEFVFVFAGGDAGLAAERSKRLIEVISRPFRIGQHELAVTPSLGISLFPDDGSDFETLLRNADAAMYQAKDAGRQTVRFYSHGLNVAGLERLWLENGLRQALRKRQFILAYQPLVCLASGRIVGCEALIRWRHPERGLLAPGVFIPVAEDTGLINGIGDWVLEEACQQAMAWRRAGLPAVRMAVNVSPVQFRQSGFVDMVAGVLAASGLDPQFLELELTERTVMHDAEANLGTLSALHRMGVSLAVDDFGTGYSSLAYLKRFPVGKLKIDQSFVRDIVEDADDLAIASTIVSIGHSLRLEVLAEGVEDAEQLRLLETQNCNFAQGYYFSRPLLADAMAGLLRQQPFAKVDEQWKKW